MFCENNEESLMNKLVLKLFVLVCIFSGLVFNSSVIAKQGPVKKNYNQASTSNNGNASFMNQAEAFRENAKSFQTRLEKMKDNEVEKSKTEIIDIVDSMLDNNEKLQQSIKEDIKNSSNEKSQDFYKRDILPNLQNLNRQLTRIKDSVEGQINLNNMRKQSARTYESISQVVDRIKQNEKQ